MRYVLLIANDVAQGEASEAEMQAWWQYTTDLEKSGKLRGGERLKPSSSATTVRQPNGKTLLSDGPFTESKEQLGGYYVVDADNLDEAVSWAEKMPHFARGGSVEVRPIWEMTQP